MKLDEIDIAWVRNCNNEVNWPSMVLTNVMVDETKETKTSEENNPKTSPKHIFNNLWHINTNTTIEFIFTLLTMWLTMFSSKKGFFHLE